MRFLITFCVPLLLSIQAYANCTPDTNSIAQTLRYRGYKTTSVKIDEVLDTRSRVQEMRLDYLRNHGHTCARVQGTKFKCNKIEKYKKFEELTKAIQKEYSNKSISFGVKEGVQLISQAPSLTQWKVNQHIEHLGKDSTSYQYYKMDHFGKIKADGEWYNVQNCSLVTRTYQYRIRASGQTFTYFAQVQFDGKP